MRKLLLIRHAKTLPNKQKIIQGWTDSQSIIWDEKKALSVKSILKKHDIHRIYCSDLFRCFMTGKKIQNVCTDELIVMQALRERYFGDLEGKSTTILHKYPFEYDFKEYNAESFDHFSSRILSAIDIILHDTQSHSAIVTHGGVIRLIAAHFNKSITSIANLDCLLICL